MRKILVLVMALMMGITSAFAGDYTFYADNGSALIYHWEDGEATTNTISDVFNQAKAVEELMAEDETIQDYKKAEYDFNYIIKEDYESEALLKMLLDEHGYVSIIYLKEEGTTNPGFYYYYKIGDKYVEVFINVWQRVR